MWLSRALPLYFSNMYSEVKNGRDEFLLYNMNFNALGTHLGD
jgi:hypothetical protein